MQQSKTNVASTINCQDGDKKPFDGLSSGRRHDSAINTQAVPGIFDDPTEQLSNRDKQRIVAIPPTKDERRQSSDTQIETTNQAAQQPIKRTFQANSRLISADLPPQNQVTVNMKDIAPEALDRTQLLDGVDQSMENSKYVQSPPSRLSSQMVQMHPAQGLNNNNTGTFEPSIPDIQAEIQNFEAYSRANNVFTSALEKRSS